jgi:hypothetical protein
MTNDPAMMSSTNPARARIVSDCRMTVTIPASHQRFLRMFYRTLGPRKEMATTAGGLGPLVIHPTITTVIATYTNIKFSTWYRNVFHDYTIGIFPTPSDT